MNDTEQVAPKASDVRDRMVNRVPYAFGAVFGLYFLIGALDLGIGKMSAPGPGMWPLIVSVILIGCCAGGLIIANGDDVDEFAGRVLRPLMGVATLSLFILMFSRVGLILSGVVVLLTWFRFMARESWPMAAALAVGTTLATYLLFVVFLGARFPDDLIASLWGGR